jgi:tetratricopeptide (TPR) repeat protein
MAPLPKFLLTSALALLLGLAGCASDSTLRTRAFTAAQTVRVAAITDAILALKQVVDDDPENFAVQNMLSGYYLKLVRESGDHAYLSQAAGAARASLTALPAEANPGGVAALARAKAASHNFAAARGDARRLVEIAPDQGYPYEILGDALLELGDYKGAAAAYKPVLQRVGASTSIATRLGRLAFLNGDTETAESYLAQSLTLAREEAPTAPEATAFSHWQLGDAAFSTGNYQTAERRYRRALAAVDDYLPALAALGRVRAARGDLAAAIATYERVIEIDPMPAFVAALGDLYQLTGRQPEAAAQYARNLDAKPTALHAGLHNRELVMFYANHDLRRAEAYRLARREYRLRRDIYGADALAWAALKAGKVREAQAASGEALRLGTQDASLLYHAGMIARAAGKRDSARTYLERALALNPQFDPLQARNARQALATVRSGSTPSG